MISRGPDALQTPVPEPDHDLTLVLQGVFSPEIRPCPFTSAVHEVAVAPRRLSSIMHSSRRGRPRGSGPAKSSPDELDEEVTVRIEEYKHRVIVEKVG